MIERTTWASSDAKKGLAAANNKDCTWEEFSDKFGGGVCCAGAVGK